MQHRKAGTTQEVAAAKAGLSVRSGRRIEHAGGTRRKAERDWRTREDPLEAVWSTELVLLLEKEPSLTGTTLLDYLEEHYPEHYDQRILRTLQRRVKQWKALHGSDREVMFRQQAVVSQQGFSDFTHPDSPVTIQGRPFAHLLYQFRLAYSGWRSVTVVQGGESYAALACGLQRALKQAGGSPLEHRTDSLSAARKNRENAWTDDYAKLCEHYGMQPTRNNPGQSHENGVVECANGSLKQRLSQQLKLRGHADFDSVAAYQALIDKVVDKLNRRIRSRFDEEQSSLQPLPGDEMADYRTLNVKC
jgi:transposase InsO family protein